MADLPAALGCQSVAGDKQQQQRQEQLAPSPDTIAVCVSRKTSLPAAEACPRPAGLSTWGAYRVVSPGGAVGFIGDRVGACASAPAPMSDNAKQLPLSSSSAEVFQGTAAGTKKHSSKINQEQSRGSCSGSAANGYRFAAGRESSDEEDGDDRPTGDERHWDDTAEDADGESSGRLPNHLLDEIWTDMGVDDAMDLDLYDFSADAGGDSLAAAAATAEDVKPPNSAARWSPGPTSASLVAGHVPPPLPPSAIAGVSTAATPAVVSLDVCRVGAVAEIRRDGNAHNGQLSSSVAVGSDDAKDDVGRACQPHSRQQHSSREASHSVLILVKDEPPTRLGDGKVATDRKDAAIADVAVDGASPSNLADIAAGSVSRSNSVSPGVAVLASCATTADGAAGDRRPSSGVSAIRSTSESLTAIAKLTRSISEAGSVVRCGSSSSPDSGSGPDSVPYAGDACRAAGPASNSCSTPAAPSPGDGSGYDGGSHSSAVQSPTGQKLASGAAHDSVHSSSSLGPMSRRIAVLPGRCSASQLSGELKATELLACELMGPQHGVGGLGGTQQHARSQAMRTRGDCSPYHVPSRPHSGGGCAAATTASAGSPTGAMAAQPYHQQSHTCNGRHETGRSLLGQAMPASGASYQPYSSDGPGRHPSGTSDGTRVGPPSNRLSSNGSAAGWTNAHAWQHHQARSSSLPDDLEMDDLTEPDRTINFSEKSQMPNYYQVPEYGGFSNGAAANGGISFNLSLGGGRSLPLLQQQNPRWPHQTPASASLHQQSWQPAAGLQQPWQQQQPFLPSGAQSAAAIDGLPSDHPLEHEHMVASQPFTSGYSSVGHQSPSVQQLQLNRAEAAATFARSSTANHAQQLLLHSSSPDNAASESLLPRIGGQVQQQPCSQAGGADASIAGADTVPESLAMRSLSGSSSSSAQQQQQPPPQAPPPGTHCFMQRLIVAERTSAFRSHPLFPLLRDLVIAEMNFDDPAFPHQLIRDLPADFDKLLHNYLARNPALLRGVPQAIQSVESVVMDALRFAHASLIEKLHMRASAACGDGSYAPRTLPPPPPPGYAAGASSGSVRSDFYSDEPQRWMQARFGLQDVAASGQCTGAQFSAAFSAAPDRIAAVATAADLTYGRDGVKAESCNCTVALSATHQSPLARYENDAGRANYYTTIERSTGSTIGNGNPALSHSAAVAPSPGASCLAHGHLIISDAVASRNVLAEQVQQQRRLLEQMAAGGRSGTERLPGRTHFFAGATVGSDRTASHLSRFGGGAVSAPATQADSLGAYSLNGDLEAATQRTRSGPLAERLTQYHGYRQSPPSVGDVASCRHGQAAGTAAGILVDSPSGSDASMSTEALSPPSPSALRFSSFAASLRQQQDLQQQRAVVGRYDRNLVGGGGGSSAATSVMSSIAADGTGSSAAAAVAAAAARKHQSLPKEAVSLMTEWLREHQDKPYPNDDEKCAMIKQTGLSMQQINYWFTNARRRLLRRWQQGSADGQSPPIDS